MPIRRAGFRNPRQLPANGVFRNQGHSITEAINRQLAHYPYHIGQMVFIGKMVRNEEWQSLSIPRGNSQAYNAEKFAQPPRTVHFTDEYLKGDPRA